MAKARITAAFVKRLAKAPPTTRTDFVDETVRGFGLRVSPSGTVSYFVRYRLYPRGHRAPGATPERRRQWLGRHPIVRTAEARDEALEILNAAQRGHDPRGYGSNETFGLFVERYLREIHGRQRAAADVERIVRRNLLPVLQDVPLVAIAPVQLREIHERITARGAPVMANRTLHVAKRILNRAVELELLPANPATRISRSTYNVERPKDRILDPDELTALWTLCESVDDAQSRVLRLILLTGQRPGEVHGMRPRDVEGDWWTIPHTKNNRVQRVFLATKALEIVEDAVVASGNDRCFPRRNGTPFDQTTLASWLRYRRSSLGFRFAPHDLRRTVITGLGALGVEERVKMAVANHTPRGVTATVYDRHSYDPQKRAALTLWHDHLVAIVKGEEGLAEVVSIHG